MKALFVLSVVVPVSLLTTLRLTGILSERVAARETITLELVKREFGRPSQTMVLGDVLRSPYASSEVSGVLQLTVADYLEHTGAIHYDTVRIVVSINLTATNLNGSIESVNILFSEDSGRTRVNLDLSDFFLENLSLFEHTNYNSKALIGLTGVNHPGNIYFSATALWKLPSTVTQTEKMRVSYELVYYNGTFYKKVIQPFQIRVVGR